MTILFLSLRGSVPLRPKQSLRLLRSIGWTSLAMTKGAVILALLFCSSAGYAAAADESAGEKALQERQRLEWKKFYLDAAGVDMPQTSLAIDFFNQAVEAYQGQDYELAREALAESLKLNARNAFAYELLGDMASEEHDLAAARENYRKAYLIQPSAKLQEKIEKAAREVHLDEGFQSFTEGHFLIRAKGKNENEIKQVAVELERLFAKLAKDFGYAPREALTVTLYERAEFEELTRLPHWVGGVYDGKIRLPAYSRGILSSQFSAVAVHEMTHAFVGRLSHKKAPAWIQEGLAVFMETQAQPRDFMVLRLAVKTNSLLPLDQLMNEEKVTQQSDVLFASLFYEQAYALTDYLLQKYGMFKIKKMLKAFADSNDYDEAIRTAFKIDLMKLEKKWKNSLTAHYPSAA